MTKRTEDDKLNSPVIRHCGNVKDEIIVNVVCDIISSFRTPHVITNGLHILSYYVSKGYEASEIMPVVKAVMNHPAYTPVATIGSSERPNWCIYFPLMKIPGCESLLTGCLESMKDAGISFDIQTQYGNTLLMVLARTGSRTNLEMVKWLIDVGADPMIENNDGRTAMDIASEQNSVFAIDFIETVFGGDRDKITEYLKTKMKLITTYHSCKDCVVCLGRPTEVTILPCGHKCACVTCSWKLSKCPLCNGPKESVMMVIKKDDDIKTQEPAKLLTFIGDRIRLPRIKTAKS